jgi:hypothetical protein
VKRHDGDQDHRKVGRYFGGLGCHHLSGGQVVEHPVHGGLEATETDRQFFQASSGDGPPAQGLKDFRSFLWADFHGRAGSSYEVELFQGQGFVGVECWKTEMREGGHSGKLLGIKARKNSAQGRQMMPPASKKKNLGCAANSRFALRVKTGTRKASNRACLLPCRLQRCVECRGPRFRFASLAALVSPCGLPAAGYPDAYASGVRRRGRRH